MRELAVLLLGIVLTIAYATVLITLLMVGGGWAVVGAVMIVPLVVAAGILLALVLE